MEILILCTKCLLQFSPPLLEMISAPQISLTQWECIVEVSFGAPKISEQLVTLTFGTVLSIVGVFTKALNLQNYGFHEVPLNSLPLGDEIPQRASSSTAAAVNTSTRPFSKSMSVTSVSSANCPSNELLANLDSELCLMALEHILTLAASQSMLTLKDCKLAQREKSLIRREISSELIYLHEFVRKKVLYQDYREHKSIWFRRKMGQIPMLTVDGAEDVLMNRPAKDATRRQSSDVRNSMRVNVVRRQHLQNQQQQQQQQQTRSPFDMTREISPISQDRERATTSHAIVSTPHLPQATLRRQAERDAEDKPKRMYTSAIDEDSVDCTDMELEQEEEEIELFPPEEPKYSPLSYVQLIEEDYLHFMSNLFMVICQSD